MSTRVRHQFEKPGVICNPHSGRARTRLNEIRNLGRKIPGSVYGEAKNQEEFEAVTREFAEAGVDLLVIIAGDGSIHGLLTTMLNSKLFASLPVLALIPAGTTNMTALDFKMAGKPDVVLERLVSALEQSRHFSTLSRPMVRVTHHDTTSRFGFFFGCGLIADAVGYFQEHIKKTGLTGEGASAIVFIRFLFLLMFRSGQLGEADKLMALQSEQLQRPRQVYMLLLVTSLQRLLFGMKPYWGENDAPLHFTVLDEKPRRLWISLFNLLCGKLKTTAETDGYYSHNTNSLLLHIQGNYVIDGEIYAAPVDGSGLSISASAPVKILDMEQFS